MIRALAVTVLFLVAAGMGLPSGAPAQTPAQGQAVGILFLLAASRSSAPARAKAPGQKPKPGTQASHESEGRIADAKQKPLPVKDGTVLVRMGGGTVVSIPEKVARPSDPLDGTVLRVTSDQKNGRKLIRPVELTDHTHTPSTISASSLLALQQTGAESPRRPCCHADSLQTLPHVAQRRIVRAGSMG